MFCFTTPQRLQHSNHTDTGSSDSTQMMPFCQSESWLMVRVFPGCNLASHDKQILQLKCEAVCCVTFDNRAICVCVCVFACHCVSTQKRPYKYHNITLRCIAFCEVT